jgi:hypothetical protein
VARASADPWNPRRQPNHARIRHPGPRGQLELFIHTCKRQVRREIEELLGDQMHNIPFALDTTVDSHHRRSEYNPPAFLKEYGQTTMFAGPVSSSMVINITPLAEPGF